MNIKSLFFTFYVSYVSALTIYALLLTGCGTGTPDNQINVSNTNTNNNASPSGEQRCVFEREPLGEGLCKVTYSCEGVAAGAPFFVALPFAECVTSSVAKTSEEVEEEEFVGVGGGVL